MSGTLTISGATATLTVTVTNTTTGVTRSVTHTGTVAGEGVFDLEKSVVDDVAKLICDPPARYAGPVSGSIPAFAGGVSGTFAWSGDRQPRARPPRPGAQRQPTRAVRLLPARGRHRPPDARHGRRALHGPRGDRHRRGPEHGGLSSVQQGVEQPTYTLYAAFGASPGIAFAWTGGTHADPCANDGTLPFGAGLPVLATATLQSASTTLVGSTTDAFPGVMGSVHREWSLVPQG